MGKFDDILGSFDLPWDENPLLVVGVPLVLGRELAAISRTELIELGIFLYKRLIQRFHPDVCKLSNREAATRRLNEAKAWLDDEKQRESIVEDFLEKTKGASQLASAQRQIEKLRVELRAKEREIHEIETRARARTERVLSGFIDGTEATRSQLWAMGILSYSEAARRIMRPQFHLILTVVPALILIREPSEAFGKVYFVDREGWLRETGVSEDTRNWLANPFVRTMAPRIRHSIRTLLGRAGLTVEEETERRRVGLAVNRRRERAQQLVCEQIEAWQKRFADKDPTVLKEFAEIKLRVGQHERQNLPEDDSDLAMWGDYEAARLLEKNLKHLKDLKKRDSVKRAIQAAWLSANSSRSRAKSRADHFETAPSPRPNQLSQKLVFEDVERLLTNRQEMVAAQVLGTIDRQDVSGETQRLLETSVAVSPQEVFQYLPRLLPTLEEGRHLVAASRVTYVPGIRANSLTTYLRVFPVIEKAASLYEVFLSQWDHIAADFNLDSRSKEPVEREVKDEVNNPFDFMNHPAVKDYLEGKEAMEDGPE